MQIGAWRSMEENLIKKWESLTISNDFLFGKVMSHPGLCQKLLERIFPDMKIDHIEYPELQKAINIDYDAKGVRLDVYVKDGNNTVYNIEMQAIDTKELPKRSRYYQSMIDLQLMDKGADYQELNQCYVIFICQTDIFHKGRHKYTFENLCTEDTFTKLGDQTCKVFLNAGGTMDDISPNLKAVLDYVAGKMSDDPYVRELDAAVTEAKHNREWRREYMTLEMKYKEKYNEGTKPGLEQGLEQGVEQGLEQGISLTKKVFKLFRQGCTEEEIAEKSDISIEQVRNILE